MSSERQVYVDLLIKLSRDIGCPTSLAGRKRQETQTGIDPEWFSNLNRILDTNATTGQTSAVTDETLRGMIQFVEEFKNAPAGLHISLLLSLIVREADNAVKVHQLGGLSVAEKLLTNEEITLQRNSLSLIANIASHSDRLKHIAKEIIQGTTLQTVLQACNFTNDTSVDKMTKDQELLLANACATLMNVITEDEYEETIKELKNLNFMPHLAFALNKGTDFFLLNKAIHLASVLASDSDFRAEIFDSGLLDLVVKQLFTPDVPEFVIGPASFCISKYGFDEERAKELCKKENLLKRLVELLKQTDAEHGGKKGSFGPSGQGKKHSQEVQNINKRLAFTVCSTLSNLLVGAQPNTVEFLDSNGFTKVLVGMLKEESQDLQILAARGLSNLFINVSDEYASTFFKSVLDNGCLDKFADLGFAHKDQGDGVFFSSLRAINMLCTGIQKKGNEECIDIVKQTLEKSENLKLMMLIIAEMEKDKPGEQGEGKAPFRVIFILVAILVAFLLGLPVVYKLFKKA